MGVGSGGSGRPRGTCDCTCWVRSFATVGGAVRVPAGGSFATGTCF